MIISRFGDTWAGGYALPLVKASDDWLIGRPPVLAQVGGADGAFDFFGDDSFPLQPVVVAKSFVLTAATYSAMDTAIDALKTLATVGRSKLWLLGRDGSTHLWSWAKVIEVNVAEKTDNWHQLPASIKFSVPEGLWYAETLSSFNLHGNINLIPFNVTVGGTYPAMPYFDFHFINASPDASYYNIQLRNFTTVHQFDYSQPVEIAETLIINAATYAISHTGETNPYQYLTVPATQLPWFKLQPGVNSCGFDYEWTGTITTSVKYMYWYNTYL